MGFINDTYKVDGIKNMTKQKRGTSSIKFNITLRCLINRGLEIFVKFINGEMVGISKYPLISVTNEKRDINV